MSWTPALACLRAQARTLGGRAVAQPSQLRLLSVTRTAAKSKRSSASEPAPPTPGDVPVIHTKGKGAKGAAKGPRGARSKRGDAEEAERDDSERYSTSTGNEELPGERFDEQGLRENMERAVKRCRETISQKVASHGRADPGLLDSVRVSFSSTGQSTSGSTSSGTGDGAQSYNLKEFATVGVKDGALLVTCFDAESLKHVERALYVANIGLTPQQVPGAEGVLRLPIPRPSAETRAELVKEVNRLCENARVSIRSARHSAQKQIKSDEKNKVVGKSEAAGEMKKMEEETKRRSAEVDQLFERAKKQIEQG